MVATLLVAETELNQVDASNTKGVENIKIIVEALSGVTEEADALVAEANNLEIMAEGMEESVASYLI